ncbi:hypothetical protein CNEO_20051 [Clostridium neonatale]|uniref:Uncharacterized protein n=1 Tax=Clostridium neonatale TaxID=137838 RepID=A0AA86JGE6_9CLOT|nr:hypothetical protein CNEO_20051 [Clostridium neonatale]
MVDEYRFTDDTYEELAKIYRLLPEFILIQLTYAVGMEIKIKEMKFIFMFHLSQQDCR